MPPTGFILHPLAAEGVALPADKDHLLARTAPGALLLIHVPPGDYAFEVHRAAEYIVCLDGVLVLESEDGGRCAVPAGAMAEVPPGLRHRFAADSRAVILTIAQSAPATAPAA